MWPDSAPEGVTDTAHVLLAEQDRRSRLDRSITISYDVVAAMGCSSVKVIYDDSKLFRMPPS